MQPASVIRWNQRAAPEITVAFHMKISYSNANVAHTRTPFLIVCVCVCALARLVQPGKPVVGCLLDSMCIGWRAIQSGSRHTHVTSDYNGTGWGHPSIVLCGAQTH